MTIKSVSAGSNITVSNTTTELTVTGSGVWTTGLDSIFEPTNMSQAVANNSGILQANAYYKSEWAPFTFTTTKIKYWRVGITETTIRFALYNSSYSRLAYTAIDISNIQGEITLNFNTSVTFTKGERFILGYSSGTSNGASILHVVLSGISYNPGTIEKAPYFYTNKWLSNPPPATVTTSDPGYTVSSGNTAIPWYILL